MLNPLGKDMLSIIKLIKMKKNEDEEFYRLDY